MIRALGVVIGTVLCLSTALLANIDSLENSSRAFSAIAKSASPAVVFVQVESASTPQFRDRRYEQFYQGFFGEDYPRSAPESPLQKGHGTGFLISDDGYILTNSHVIARAERVEVRLEDGRKFKATIIGDDPQSDVAVLKIEGKGLPFIPLGNSNTLNVGEWVIAIGNPFGLSHTLTVGVVSAKGRSDIGIANYENFIQTDAAINPGNSGGPLLNIKGEAVGVNTAIFSQRSGGYIGIGFAIPINMATTIKKQLIEKGKVTRGYIGVSIQDLSEELARSFTNDPINGVLVAQVFPDSPAAKAGIRQGDIIQKIDSKRIRTVNAFRNQIALSPPGKTCRLQVLRGNREFVLSLTVTAYPQDRWTRYQSQDKKEELGLSVQTMTPQIAENNGIAYEQGVWVDSVLSGSLGDLAGLIPKMIILELNKQKIRDVKQFQNLVSHPPRHGRLLLLVQDPQGHRYYLAMKSP